MEINGSGGINGFFAISNGHYVNALIFQGKTDHLLDVAVVVRNENLRHYTASGDTSPAQATPAAPQPKKACPAWLHWSIRGRARQSYWGRTVSQNNTAHSHSSTRPGPSEIAKCAASLPPTCLTSKLVPAG